MDKQIEAVAIALWNEVWYIMKPQLMEDRTPLYWEDAPDFDKDNYRRYAKAAIQASGAEHVRGLVETLEWLNMLFSIGVENEEAAERGKKEARERISIILAAINAATGEK